MFLSCVFDLLCEVGGIGSLPLGENALSFPPLELFTYESTLLCHFSPVVLAKKLHCCWHYFQPHFNCGYASSWPWFLSGVLLIMSPVQTNRSQVPGLQ